jgi:hypothetical protein
VILLLAIAVGLISALLRARYHKRRLVIPNLRLTWLILIAFLPQLLAFGLPWTRGVFPLRFIPGALVGSLILLLAFTLLNGRQPGFAVLGFGLLLNLSVIVMNGGWMPISPETVAYFSSKTPLGAWQNGGQLGATKDIVLPKADTRLWFLSDRFVTPTWFPLHSAFSLGDVLIAVGVLWFFWSLGGPPAGQRV